MYCTRRQKLPSQSTLVDTEQGYIHDCTYQIIHTDQVGECREIMAGILASGKPVAVDCEGMNLGRNGRLTLIGVCTWDKHIYLLDLIDRRDVNDRKPAADLLKKGLVQNLLESVTIEKVMYRCNRDSGALWHQFGIELQTSHVFDVQAADGAVQISSGICFPKKNNLNRIAQLHGAPKTQKSDIHAKAIKANHQLWNCRPLTKEMIKIACYDVLTLSPRLYNQLKRRLDRENAWDLCRQIGGWNIKLQINPKAVGADRMAEADKRVGKLLQAMHKRYQHEPKAVNLSSLSEEEQIVLGKLRVPRNWRKWSPYIKECGGMNTITSLRDTYLLDELKKALDKLEIEVRNMRASQGQFE